MTLTELCILAHKYDKVKQVKGSKSDRIIIKKQK